MGIFAKRYTNPVGMKSGGSVQAPRTANIADQHHKLAYINNEEEALLRARGGTGQPGPKGIPAFPPDDGNTGASTGGMGHAGNSGAKGNSSSTSGSGGAKGNPGDIASGGFGTGNSSNSGSSSKGTGSKGRQDGPGSKTEGNNMGTSQAQRDADNKASAGKAAKDKAAAAAKNATAAKAAKELATNKAKRDAQAKVAAAEKAQAVKDQAVKDAKAKELATKAKVTLSQKNVLVKPDAKGLINGYTKEEIANSQKNGLTKNGWGYITDDGLKVEGWQDKINGGGKGFGGTSFGVTGGADLDLNNDRYIDESERAKGIAAGKDLTQNGWSRTGTALGVTPLGSGYAPTGIAGFFDAGLIGMARKLSPPSYTRPDDTSLLSNQVQMNLDKWWEGDRYATFDNDGNRIAADPVDNENTAFANPFTDKNEDGGNGPAAPIQQPKIAPSCPAGYVFDQATQACVLGDGVAFSPYVQSYNAPVLSPYAAYQPSSQFQPDFSVPSYIPQMPAQPSGIMASTPTQRYLRTA